MEELESSIKSTEIVNFTKTSVKLKFHLHPHLMKYDLQYNITTSQLQNPTTPTHNKPVVFTSKASDVELQVKNLEAMVSYVVDVEVRYKGIDRPGRMMKKPFVFRIKGERIIFL